MNQKQVVFMGGNSLLRRFRGSSIAFVILSMLLCPTDSNADDAAHGLWGVGVQIGLAEYGSFANAAPAFLIQSLEHAKRLAILSGCIPTDGIDELIAAMRAATQSKDVYPSIAAYRQNLASYVQENCSCVGGRTSIDAFDLRGTWTGWGTILIQRTGSDSYKGTYTDTFGPSKGGKKLGYITLKIEGTKVTGTWGEGSGRTGELFDVKISKDGRKIYGKYRTTKTILGGVVKSASFTWTKK